MRRQNRGICFRRQTKQIDTTQLGEAPTTGTFNPHGTMVEWWGWGFRDVAPT